MGINKKLENAFQIVLIVLLVTCIVVTGFLIISGKSNLVLFVPFFFVVILLLSKNTRESIGNLDFITLYIVLMMFMRYYLYPFLLCAIEDKGFYTQEIMSQAMILFWVEEVITLAALNLLLGKLPYRYQEKYKPHERNTSSWLIVLCAVVSVLVVVALPSVGKNYQFILDATVESMQATDYTSSVESIGYVIVDVSRLLIPLTIINICYEKYNRNYKQIYVILSLIAALIPMLVIKQMNRGSSFNTCLVYIWLVIRLFGWKKARRFAILTIGAAVGLLAVVSIIKHSSALSMQGYTLSYAYDVSQSYSLGITQLRNGLLTNQHYSSMNRLLVAYNDIICSFPILNRLGDATQRYSALYNSVVYWGRYNSNAALAPVLTNVLFTLGPFGFFVPLVFLYLSLKMYFKSYTKKSINKQFVLVYLSLVFEAGRTGSFSATLSTLIWMIVPLIVIVNILESVKIKVKT